LLRRVVRAARARAAAAPLKRLRRHPDATVRRIGLVLAQPHTDPEIETQRAAMLGDGSPLDDGTLPGSLRHDAGLSIGQACRASMPPRKAAVLSALAGAFQPACAVELGTNVGVSAAYIARAVRGTLTTFEVSPYRLRAARRLPSDWACPISATCRGGSATPWTRRCAGCPPWTSPSSTGITAFARRWTI